MITTWPGLDEMPGGSGRGEYAFGFDRGRHDRLLVIPALFDEHNRLRRFTVETLRALDAAGVDTLLPDLPGTNESTLALRDQSLATWRAATTAAAAHFGATRVLALRGGALVAPELPGWIYAPVSGAAILRQMLRARVLASREAGREETQENLLEIGRAAGLDLAGYLLGSALFTQLGAAVPAKHLATISQADIGGAGLWLRAEPDENPQQSGALAALIVAGWRT